MKIQEKRKRMQKLEKDLLNRKNFEFLSEPVGLGFGYPNAEYFFIGMNPNKNIEFHGVRCFRPYSELCHRSSEILIPLLNKIFNKNYYITNLVKVPTKDNKEPSSLLVKIFIKYLIQEIEIIKPKIIISLGNWVFKTLSNNKIKTIKIYHPAAVTRGFVFLDEYEKKLKEIKK